MANKNTYEAEGIVKRYSAQNMLFKPEESILKLLKNKLKNMRVLDIGVGGGRTAYHFAPLAKEYVGIDYSKKMIDACKKRFSNCQKSISFELCDVRHMDKFKEGYFGFILVSANGLDYMPHKDRLQALQEIRRIGAKGGFFCLSSHNIQTISKLMSLELSFSPLKMLRNLIRYILLRLFNRNLKKLKNNKYAIVNDGAHQFRLTTYYIQPKEQIKQLSALGFRNIKVYSLESGKEMKKSEMYATTDGLYHGLYYLSRIL